MRIRTTRARFLGTALMAAAFAVVSPAVQVEAQAAQQTADTQSVDDERLTQYARLHVAINVARDAFQAAKARVHDFEARERIREEMDARLNGLYTEHGMSKEDYDGLTFMVSIDADMRTRLEAILAELGTPSEN